MRPKAVIFALGLGFSVLTHAQTTNTITSITTPATVNEKRQDPWGMNAPLVASELRLWRMSDSEREMFDQKGRWLKARLSAATKNKTSISPFSEGVVVFAGRYMDKPITKSFLDMGVAVPPMFSALQTDTLGATPGTQESIDLIKECVRTGSEAQSVICQAIAASLAAEWSRPTDREIQLSAKDVFGDSETLRTIMEIVGNKVDDANGGEVLDPMLSAEQSVIDRSMSVVVVKKALLKAESYLDMMSPVQYQ